MSKRALIGAALIGLASILGGCATDANVYATYAEPYPYYYGYRYYGPAYGYHGYYYGGRYGYPYRAYRPYMPYPHAIHPDWHGGHFRGVHPGFHGGRFHGGTGHHGPPGGFRR